MSKDLYIFTNGVDPFVFKVKKVVVHVYTSAPPLAVTQPGSSAPPNSLKPAPPAPLDPATYTPLQPVLGVRVMTPGDEVVLDEIDGSWQEAGLGKILARAGAADHPPLSQLASVLEKLSSADNDDITACVYMVEDE